MCAAVWSSTISSVGDPRLFISAAYPDASDRTRRNRCKRENNLWYPGQSRLDFRHLSSPAFDASRKELFRKDERGLILKTAAANRAYNRQKGQLRVIFSLNGRKLLSSLQARWVLLWGKNPSPALDKSVLTVSRYILEILEPVYSAPILAAFGLSISPAHGDL